MNKAKLKSYAPQARRDFIAAVTARANLLGLSEKAGKLEVVSSQPQGDATVIGGQVWPLKVHSQRKQLINRIEKDGFTQTMEAVAYTWFNRFAALRYMELHDYLVHGYRALSSAEGSLPDILTHAIDLAERRDGEGGLPGLKSEQIVEMKLAGNRDGELYRMLLVAQCNALSNIMPFLFERIDDETELLLPDHLLRTDSVIAKLVASIDEDDWKEVEIVGWLYQFYISEKKDEVIGKVVKSEDIPAATQLFTPNWIVQYLVQNSVGRLWLMTNPTSTLYAQWPYYIEPAVQTPEAQAHLEALIQTRVGADCDSLNPESITLLDPACGSGHILVEAYEVFKAIYLERGYQPRSIPRLILEKNLYGLDIDDRAAQMAGFALLMKARMDDRRLFNEPIKLNVLSLRESRGLDSEELAIALQTVVGADSHRSLGFTTTSVGGEGDLFTNTFSQSSLENNSGMYSVNTTLQLVISALIRTFAHAKTFGSLIQIPKGLAVQLDATAELLQLAVQTGDLYAKVAAQDLLPLVAQAKLLAMQFDSVVANPPYMGSKGMNPLLKDYAKATFPESKSDLFALFMERGFGWCKPTGFNSMVTMQSWMFLSSYESMRQRLLGERTLSCMLHMGNGVMGIAFGTAATIFFNKHINNYDGSFSFCDSEDINLNGIPRVFPVANERLKTAKPDDFKRIPGSPIAYWISDNLRSSFVKFPSLSSLGKPRQGLATSDNNRFLRRWYEPSLKNVAFNISTHEDAVLSERKWFPCQKGGAFRKWYGNNEFVVNWKNDGEELLAYAASLYGSPTRTIKNIQFYFRDGISWSTLSSSSLSMRYVPKGFLFETKGAMCFFDDKEAMKISLGFCNSIIVNPILQCISPTLDFHEGPIGTLPIAKIPEKEIVQVNVDNCIDISRLDWDEFETSWDFKSPYFVRNADRKPSLEAAWEQWADEASQRIHTIKSIERENNRIFIEAYGLHNELSRDVSDDQITLARADREKDAQRLISYAIGCMMGRYSLDAPGLIYANGGNVDFDASCYVRFPADADGIVPITDGLWFEDEAASRIREMLLAVWGEATLTENIVWLAESLGAKNGETAEETIRRYLSEKFFKDHLQTYKKRPIYWLFSSGKQSAFQALVYLHRYHEGTLGRMRAEYVVPLTGKIQSRIDMLEEDAASSSSTAARNKLNKEVERLKKKQQELLAYDEQLRHYADMRITLDLDDGVKVNYGKFGNLLAEVKAVAGGKDDE